MLRRLLVQAGVVLSLALLGYLAWWFYELGKVHGVTELGSLRQEHARLEEAHGLLETENEALREQVAILDRSSSIDRQAAQEVQNELGALQNELLTVREEMEFYRGIVSPGNVKPGLYLHRFELEKGLQPGQFHYDLVLTQLKRNDRDVTGVVEWRITGKLDDELRELDLAAVTNDQVDKLEFRFRYYQHLTGTVTLPKGFRAREVRLTIRPTGKKAPDTIEQVIEWPASEA